MSFLTDLLRRLDDWAEEKTGVQEVVRPQTVVVPRGYSQSNEAALAEAGYSPWEWESLSGAYEGDPSAWRQDTALNYKYLQKLQWLAQQQFYEMRRDQRIANGLNPETGADPNAVGGGWGGGGQSRQSLADKYAEEMARAEAAGANVNPGGKDDQGFLSTILEPFDRIASTGAGLVTGLAGMDIAEDSEFGNDDAGVLDFGAALRRAKRAAIDGDHLGFGDTESLQYDEDDAGWERWAKAGATFGADVLADPLTYVTFGAGSIGRKGVSELVEAGARRAASGAVQGAARSGRDDLVRMLARNAGDEDTIRRALLDDFAAIAPDTRADDLAEYGIDELFDASRAIGGRGIDDLAEQGFVNRAAAAYADSGSYGLRSRLIGDLGEEAGEQAFRGMTRSAQGGIRFHNPFTPGRTARREMRGLADDVTNLTTRRPLTGGGRLMEHLPGGEGVLRGTHQVRNAVLRRSRIGQAANRIAGGRTGDAWNAVLREVHESPEDVMGIGYATYRTIRDQGTKFESWARRLDDDLKEAATEANRLLHHVDGASAEQVRKATNYFFLTRQTAEGIEALPEELKTLPPAAIEAGSELASYLYGSVIDRLGYEARELLGDDVMGWIGSDQGGYVPRQLSEAEKALRDEERVGRSKARGGSNPAASRSGAYATWQWDPRTGRMSVAEWWDPKTSNAIAGREVFETDALRIAAGYADKLRGLLRQERLIKGWEELGVLARTAPTGREFMTSHGMAKAVRPGLNGAKRRAEAIAGAVSVYRKTGDVEPLRRALADMDGSSVSAIEELGQFRGKSTGKGTWVSRDGFRIVNEGTARKPAWRAIPVDEDDFDETAMPVFVRQDTIERPVYQTGDGLPLTETDPDLGPRPAAPGGGAAAAAPSGPPAATVAEGVLESAALSHPRQMVEALFENEGRIEAEHAAEEVAEALADLAGDSEWESLATRKLSQEEHDLRAKEAAVFGGGTIPEEVTEWSAPTSILPEARARVAYTLNRAADDIGWVDMLRDSGMKAEVDRALSGNVTKMIRLGGDLGDGDDLIALWPLIDTLRGNGWELKYRAGGYTPMKGGIETPPEYRLVPPSKKKDVAAEAAEALRARGLPVELADVVAKPKVPTVRGAFDVSMWSKDALAILDIGLDGVPEVKLVDGQLHGTLRQLETLLERLDPTAQYLGHAEEYAAFKKRGEKVGLGQDRIRPPTKGQRDRAGLGNKPVQPATRSEFLALFGALEGEVSRLKAEARKMLADAAEGKPVTAAPAPTTNVRQDAIDAMVPPLDTLKADHAAAVKAEKAAKAKARGTSKTAEEADAKLAARKAEQEAAAARVELEDLIAAREHGVLAGQYLNRLRLNRPEAERQAWKDAGWWGTSMEWYAPVDFAAEGIEPGQLTRAELLERLGFHLDKRVMRGEKLPKGYEPNPPELNAKLTYGALGSYIENPLTGPGRADFVRLVDQVERFASDGDPAKLDRMLDKGYQAVVERVGTDLTRDEWVASLTAAPTAAPAAPEVAEDAVSAAINALPEPPPGHVRVFRGMAEPLDPERVTDEGARFTRDVDYAITNTNDEPHPYLYELVIPEDKLLRSEFAEAYGDAGGRLPHAILTPDDVAGARLLVGPDGPVVAGAAEPPVPPSTPPAATGAPDPDPEPPTTTIVEPYEEEYRSPVFSSQKEAREWVEAQTQGKRDATVRKGLLDLADEQIERVVFDVHKMRTALDLRNLPEEGPARDKYLEDLARTIGEWSERAPKEVRDRFYSRPHDLKSRYTKVLEGEGRVELRDPHMQKRLADRLEAIGAYSPKEVATHMARYHRAVVGSETFDSFMDGFWKPYFTLFKTLATVGRGPGFVARNVVGGAFNAWLYDVQTGHFADSGKAILAQRRARDRAIEQLGGDESVVSEKQVMDLLLGPNRDADEGSLLREEFAKAFKGRASFMLDAWQKYGDVEGGSTPGRYLDAFSTSSRSGTLEWDPNAPDVDEALKSLAGDRRIIQREDPSLLARGANKAMDNRYIKWMGRNAETSETFLRFATFVKGAEEFGLDDGGFAASIGVHGTQFLYGAANVSDVEARFIKHLVPFYTWSRNNVPLQFRAAFSDPRKMQRVLHLNDALREQFGTEVNEDGEPIVLPDWVEERYGWATRFVPGDVPGIGRFLGEEGANLAVMVESPFTDVNRMVEAPEGLNPGEMLATGELTSQLNPVVKLAAEILTGTNTFSGEKFDEAEEAPNWMKLLTAGQLQRAYPSGEQVVDPRIPHAVRSLLPPVGQAERLLPFVSSPRYAERVGTSWATNVGGLPAMTLTDRQQAGERLARMDRLEEQIDLVAPWGTARRQLIDTLIDEGVPAHQIERLLASYAE